MSTAGPQKLLLNKKTGLSNSAGEAAQASISLFRLIYAVIKAGELGGPAKGCSSFNYCTCVDREIFVAEKFS